jgi:sphinganine-1-phosphate aldolase
VLQVVEQLQSGGGSTKKNLRTELPDVGVREGVIEELQGLKDKDVKWQGKCSGTVYVYILNLRAKQINCTV